MAEHFRDIEKIQDVLHEAQTGLWAIELEEGREPRMYADKAMLELLYATGIRVSELINLKVEDINLAVGFIACRDEHKERMIPFGKVAKQAMLN